MTDRIDEKRWVALCVARLVELDPALDPELAWPIAEEMFTRARWRSMAPDAAASTVFEFGRKPGPSGARSPGADPSAPV